MIYVLKVVVTLFRVSSIFVINLVPIVIWQIFGFSLGFTALFVRLPPIKPNLFYSSLTKIYKKFNSPNDHGSRMLVLMVFFYDDIGAPSWRIFVGTHTHIHSRSVVLSPGRYAAAAAYRLALVSSKPRFRLSWPATTPEQQQQQCMVHDYVVVTAKTLAWWSLRAQY